MTELAIILEESHKDLYQWFLMHQECLLLQHDEYAECCWQAFSQQLRNHIAFENSHFLNENSPIHSYKLQWSVLIYQKEHDKVLQKLEELEELFQYYLQQQGRKKRIVVIELLEKQVTFRHLLEHHETREEEDLFRRLPELECSIIAAFMEKDKANQALKEKVKNFLQSY